ncbi:hypothetical protein JRQ81_004627 [Phrynocephalus forsythii]|uniref:Uncharacterized protein n=1 Tax=Phrynocephalus forsythii TaxID=171643 RepID=A0A9Q1AUR1_9SAUR|nr:hypothetical protein JRQ81_004627 [Phrynocephalus forsythii]
MLGGGGGRWRQHVRAELRRRERRARGLRDLLEHHEKLRGAWEAEQMARAEELLARAAAAGGGGGGGGASRLPSVELAALHVHLEREVAELRRERDQLRQQVVLVSDVLRETEAENQEQRARMGRFAQEAAVLAHQYEEAQSKVWILSQEAKGLRTELEEAQRLLQEVQRKRQELEARWLQEKALEAKRLNWANEREEKSQKKVMRLRAELERMQEAAGLAQGSKITDCREMRVPLLVCL